MITREFIIFAVVIAVILVAVSMFINPVMGIFAVCLIAGILPNGKGTKPK
jgi:lipopolysaccharide export LptBFGC system permease protein LptF